MTLADPRTSPLAALAAADFVATLGDAAVDAVYRPKGQGSGAPVKVLVTGKPDGPVIPERVDGVAPDRPMNAFILQVARRRVDEPLTDAASGVGDWGGVVQAQTGDTFTVPGSAVNRDDRAEAVLRVGPNIRLVEHAYWRCEVKGG